jgi:hypothetical protein
MADVARAAIAAIARIDAVPMILDAPADLTSLICPRLFHWRPDFCVGQ